MIKKEKKTLSKLRIERNNLKTGNYKKPTANIIANGEKNTEHLLLRFGIKRVTQAYVLNI